MNVPAAPLPADAERAARRARVLDALGDGALILASGRASIYSHDVHARWRPDADFLYLTGLREPEAVLVLRPGAGAPFTLFVRPRVPEEEAWTGPRPGPEGAIADHGADAAYPLAELDARLPDLLDGAARLFHAPWKNPALDAAIHAALGRLAAKELFGRRAPRVLVDPATVLHEMRLVKSAFEIARLERAAAVTCAGQRAGLARVAPGVTEYQVQAAVEHAFLSAGAAGPGFETIAAAGANGCVLHYVSNRATIGAGDLVLLDAGAEVDDYNGDVTRTVPAAGRFTPAQRAVYEAVRETLEQLTEAVRPGATMGLVREQAARLLTARLVDLGLLAGSLDELVEEGTYKKYTLHGPSHWLGMDVHDVGAYREKGAFRPFVPGMVMTMEPGLYIAPGDESAPAEFRGLAVRIEDDLLVTEDGCRALTRDLPVDADDVAALVGVAEDAV